MKKMSNISIDLKTKEYKNWIARYKRQIKKNALPKAFAIRSADRIITTKITIASLGLISPDAIGRDFLNG